MTLVTPQTIKLVKSKENKPCPCRIAVQVRTFGSMDSYEGMTVHVSKSGLLVKCSPHIPFQLNTLLELTIDPLSAQLTAPLRCVARVTWLEKEKGSEPGRQATLGVELSDYDSVVTFDKWARYVDTLADDAA